MFVSIVFSGSDCHHLMPPSLALAGRSRPSRFLDSIIFCVLDTIALEAASRDSQKFVVYVQLSYSDDVSTHSLHDSQASTDVRFTSRSNPYFCSTTHNAGQSVYLYIFIYIHTYIHTFISVKGNGENIINKTVMTNV